MERNRKVEYSTLIAQAEHDILRLVGMGYSDKEIAEMLGYSNPQSVKNRMGFIFTKLGAFNRTEAVARALEEKILIAEDLIDQNQDFDFDSLTSRQKVVANMMFDPETSGLKIVEIASELQLSDDIVKNEITGVKRKLGLRNRAHGVALAFARRKYQQTQNKVSA